MAVRALTVSMLLTVPVLLAGSQSWKNTAPESFKANGQVLGAGGGAAAVVTIRVERYTTEAEHEAIAKALKAGGHAAFLEALHQAPTIGSVGVGSRSVAIRWARERTDGSNRRIVLVTEAPIYFIGAGSADARPTEGFDVAALEFTVDSVGLGKGTMAPAARMKFSETSGVELDEYAGKRVTLVTVTRDIS